MSMNLDLSTSEEQAAYNAQECATCGVQRFQHVNAILCTEYPTEPTTVEIMNELAEMKASLKEITDFFDMLKQAMMQNPLAKQMLGM